MGKTFIPVKTNGMDIMEVYKKLKKAEVISASDMGLWNNWNCGLLDTNLIDEIEVGTDGTTESIIRLTDNRFIAVKNGD